ASARQTCSRGASITTLRSIRSVGDALSMSAPPGRDVAILQAPAAPAMGGGEGRRGILGAHPEDGALRVMAHGRSPFGNRMVACTKLHPSILKCNLSVARGAVGRPRETDRLPGRRHGRRTRKNPSRTSGRMKKMKEGNATPFREWDRCRPRFPVIDIDTVRLLKETRHEQSSEEHGLSLVRWRRRGGRAVLRRNRSRVFRRTGA